MPNHALPADQQQAAIESAGMRVQAAPRRLTSLPVPVGLALSAGDQPGEIDWHCDAVKGASFYVPEYTVGPVGPGSVWLPVRPTTKSSGTIPGLTGGAAVSVRLHAEGTHEVTGGPASAGLKIAP